MDERNRPLGGLLTKMRLAASISWWALQPVRERHAVSGSRRRSPGRR
jgi:hypothetical protein